MSQFRSSFRSHSQSRPLVVPVCIALALATGLAMLAPAPARAAGPAAVVATTTTVSAPARVEGATSPVTVRVRAAGGNPVADVPVVLARLRDGVWQELARTRTAADGTVSVPVRLTRAAADNVVRARYAGGDAVPGDGGDPPSGATYGASGSGPVTVSLVRRTSRITLGAPRGVRDGERARLRVHRRTGAGQPVAGRARVQQRTASGWRTIATVRLGAEGWGGVTVRPRRNTRYRARAGARDWVRGAVSAGRLVRNLPPGDVVRLPAGAPRPRVGLPAQRRVLRDAADTRITRIPTGVWRTMTGRSWHRGCPVGRAGLRLLRVTYWGYDGYRRRGEMVVAAWAASRTAGALREMYQRGFPIRRMYRVDRFGWSRRVQGANDYRSMAAGNSSGFNCRSVVNKPGVRSPHAWGGAIDINTWENPYRSRTGWVPNLWWAYRAHGRVAWRSASHPVVQIWARHGFRWTYGIGDSQHFDAVRGNGRVIAPRGCTRYCH